jgi:hypothetical protein
MSTLLRQLKGESQRYTNMDSHGLGKLLYSAAERIAELEKKLSLRAKRINAAIDVIDSDSEDCKFEAVSILSGENDEALRNKSERI